MLTPAARQRVQHGRGRDPGSVFRSSARKLTRGRSPCRCWA